MSTGGPGKPLLADSFADAVIAAQVHAALFGADAPPTTLGRFRVVRALGSGAMGTVWLAHDDELDRAVAVKLLRTPLAGDPELQARLLGEARALAKLAHPNVVVVHEVGTAHGGGFVAMEYIEGESLAQWQAECARSPDEIVAMYLQVGAGLAAAHEVGVVHRDFKPDNVLVGRDGRPRVVDFGLARPSGAREGGDPLSLMQTHAGALLGTPAYMAPEQLAGATADARSDQFSFAVALYEAIVGQRPFVGDDLASLRTAMARDGVPAWSPKLPRALRIVLGRALAIAPAQRWPDMRSLLTALAATRRRRWRLAVPLSLAAVAGAWALGRDDRCRDAGSAERDAWGESRRAALHDSFERSSMPFAATAWSTTAAGLDAASARMVDAARAACVATGVRDDADFAPASASCLRQSRDEVERVLAGMASGSPGAIAAAPHRVLSLSDATACADPRRAKLVALLDPDDASSLAAAADALAAARLVHAELVFAASDDFSARLEGALVDARQAAAGAERLGAWATASGARLLEAKLLQRQGDMLAAERAAARAVEHATVIDDPSLRAHATIQLIYAIASDSTRASEARALAEQAAALLAAMGDPPLLRGQLENDLGLLIARAGGDDREAAVTHHRNAIAAFEQSLGAAHPDTLAARINLASALGRLDRAREALTELEPAVPQALAVWGEHHPSTARLFGVIGNAWLREGDLEQARTWLRRALASARGGAADDLEVANALYNLAAVLRRSMQTTPADAREAVALLEDAIAIRERIEGAASSNLAAYLVALGESQLAAGQPVAAEQVLRRALRGWEREGAAAADFARVRLMLAEALVGRDDAEARVLARDARADFATLGRTSAVERCDALIASLPRL
ncbi:MAG: serine/threonine protein kinase [Deltaproteobacteria bacterium]|nr:serine/threonine protein kinase [Deltaproteobacteria bacterium]